MADIQPRTLSSLLRSFGFLRRSPGAPWLERAGVEFLACSRDFSLMDLALFLWGFAKLGVRPPAAVLDEHTACVVRSLAAPALAGPPGASLAAAGSPPAESETGVPRSGCRGHAPTLRERRTSVNQVATECEARKRACAARRGRPLSGLLPGSAGRRRRPVAHHPHDAVVPQPPAGAAPA